MSLPRWTLRISLFSIAAIAVVLAILTILTPAGSNCGGNSAALSNARMYFAIVNMAATRRPDHQFAITSATPEEREELAEVAKEFWTRGAHYLVSIMPYHEGELGPPRLIIVCDTPYTNIPYRLAPSPPTHAAGYSDGSVALLSAAEYAAIDHSMLVPLDQLLDDRSPGSPSPRPSGPVLPDDRKL
jgi:hypothetical protein